MSRKTQMFNVLKPIYKRVGVTRDGEPMFSVSWAVIGKARNMQDAKKFHPTPVLSPVWA